MRRELERVGAWQHGLSQAKRQTRCPGGCHRSDVVGLSFSVFHELVVHCLDVQGKKKRRRDRSSLRASRVQKNELCNDSDEQTGGYLWKKWEDAP